MTAGSGANAMRIAHALQTSSSAVSSTAKTTSSSHHGQSSKMFMLGRVVWAHDSSHVAMSPLLARNSVWYHRAVTCLAATD